MHAVTVIQCIVLAAYFTAYFSEPESCLARVWQVFLLAWFRLQRPRKTILLPSAKRVFKTTTTKNNAEMVFWPKEVYAERVFVVICLSKVILAWNWLFQIFGSMLDTGWPWAPELYRKYKCKKQWSPQVINRKDNTVTLQLGTVTWLIGIIMWQIGIVTGK